MDHWASRPMNQMNVDGMFKIAARPTSIVRASPLERQRQKDGSPITRGNVTSLHPPEQALIVKSAKRESVACDSDAEVLAKAQSFIHNFMN